MQDQEDMLYIYRLPVLVSCLGVFGKLAAALISGRLLGRVRRQCMITRCLEILLRANNISNIKFLLVMHV